MVAKNAMDCMHGFAIQGNFESARRNYTRVWSMLQQGLATGRVPPPYGSRPFHLHLVGRGLVSALALPKDLSNITSVHYNLAFPAYYEQVRAVCLCVSVCVGGGGALYTVTVCPVERAGVGCGAVWGDCICGAGVL
jgi:hypothetical protein